MRRWIQDQKFHATLPHKIDRAVEEAQKAFDQQVEDEKPKPHFTEDKTGSSLLGGEMRIQAPWKKNKS